jgi:hypothetical protein
MQTPIPSVIPMKRLTVKNTCLYVCTLLASIFSWWVGTNLMNELTGFLGIILCLFAMAPPLLLVVDEFRCFTRK